MNISNNLVHVKWKKNIFSVRDVCLFAFFLVCFSMTPWDVRIKKRTYFWGSMLLFCKTRFILMAQFLYRQMLNDSVIYTAGFSDKMCSFNRCFLLSKWKRFHPLCLIYPLQASILPLYRTLWALHNTLLKYSYFTSRETGYQFREMFTPPISAYFSHLMEMVWILPFP